MESLLIVIDIVAAVGIVALVLIQQGKGADMGASFGSGASQTLFGSAGTGNVLSRSTAWLAVVFFVANLGLAVVARDRADSALDDVGSLLSDPTAATAPAPTQLPELSAEASVAPAVEAPAQSAAEQPAAAAAAVTDQVEAAAEQAAETSTTESTTPTAAESPAATVEPESQTQQN